MADSQENKDLKPTQTDTLSDNSVGPESKAVPDKSKPKTTVEHGGPKGLEPTRYGDWENNGRCTDF